MNKNNDNRIISDFRKDAHSVQLSSAEKEHVKNHIIFSPYVFNSTFWTYKKLVGVIALLLIVLMGAGTSFAAASSLPGDALYGVKVNVNEEVQSFVAISPDARAKVESDRVKERLNEAEELSSQGRLTAQTQTIIKQNLKRHTDTIKANVAVLASEKKTEEVNEVIDDLQTSLNQHQAALETISSSTAKVSASSTEETDIHNVISSVIETKAEIETIKQSIDDNTGDQDHSTTHATSTATSTATTTISTELDADTGVEAASTSTATTTTLFKRLRHISF